MARRLRHAVPRYRFSEFILSPRRRMLVRSGREQPLIPRYFDLLVFLVEHRGEAVHRRDIFDRVWNDVIVSDSALSQAIRSIRRVLGDDPREPRFVATVSRHGYRFVFKDVVEEDDDAEWQIAEERAEFMSEEEEPREPVQIRLRRAAVGPRWVGAATGGGLAGVCGGVAGGLALMVAPGSTASLAVLPVVTVIGGVCGAAGGAGVGGGVSVAESLARSRRAVALVGSASIGGGVAGSVAQWLGRWTLAALVGVNLEIGGGLEGLVLGAAAGFGYSAATLGAEGGLAAPRGPRRPAVAGLTALACGLAALTLTLAGRPLVGGTIHAIAEASRGSQATLAPLGHLIGETDFGPVTAAVVGTAEGAVFGVGLALGLTRRPKT